MDRFFEAVQRVDMGSGFGFSVGKGTERARRFAKTLYQRVRYPALPGTHPTLLVAGVQRSGTNMLMNALERSVETDVHYESDARAFDNYSMRELDLILGLREKSRAPVFVIKCLLELHKLGSLLDHLAPARAIWMLRDYNDVVNSMMVAFPKHCREIHRVAAVREDAGWWGAGLADDVYALVQDAVDRGISEPDCSALIWYIRNRLFFDTGLDQDPRVKLISYERLTTEPERYLPKICKFAGITYRSALGARIHVRSIRRRPPPSLSPDIKEASEALFARLQRRVAD
jgi:hypothetical protein